MSQATITRPIAVVLNRSAGALLQSDDAAGAFAEHFSAAGMSPHLIPADAGPLPERIRLAQQASPHAIIVGGGDGTVACAAQVLAGSDTVLGIIPCGTMNLLAKDLGLPAGAPDQAIGIIAAGRTSRIDIAEVNGHVFLCASMIGLPAKLGRVREAQRDGTHRLWLVSRVGLAFLRMLRRYLPRRLVIEADGVRRTVRSPSVTVAANAVDEPEGRLFGRSRLDQGELAVYIIRRLTLVHAVGLAIAWFRGAWR